MLMKRKIVSLISLLLVLVMVLTACGGGSTPQEPDAQPGQDTQQPDTQPSGQDGQESDGQTGEDEQVPDGDLWFMETVEIGMDNWDQYFELVPVRSCAACVLGGIVPYPEKANYYEFELRLRDEYAQAIRNLGTYYYPETTGGIPVDAIGILLMAEEAGVEEYPEVEFTYQAAMSLEFMHFAYWTENDLEEKQGKIGPGACLRYLMASEGMLEEEYNDLFLSVFTPMIHFEAAKDADYSRFGGSDGLEADWIAENVQIEITGIHGTVPVWVEG